MLEFSGVKLSPVLKTITYGPNYFIIGNTIL